MQYVQRSLFFLQMLHLTHFWFYLVKLFLVAGFASQMCYLPVIWNERLFCLKWCAIDMENNSKLNALFIASYCNMCVYAPFKNLVTSIVITHWHATKRILLKYLFMKIIISFVRIESSSKLALHGFSVTGKDFFARKE